MYERRPGFFREDTPPGRRVEAKVKWFNAGKGFGFVTPADGSQDAFLPMAVLRRAGYEDAREGASISCEVSDGAKGPLVTSVLNIDNSTATAPSFGGGGFDRRTSGASMTIEGAVKWFEPEKGYGFISPDGGGKDVFIHITALRRSGVAALEAGQRVRVEVVDGKKGQEAERVTLI
jgi:cold shock protein